MQLTLKWKNHNTLPTTTKIYRSETPLNKASLPAPIASVSAANEQYTDTVEYGKRYYYMMENVNSKGNAFTGNKEVWALPRTGPGPQNLLSGDMNLGCFGYVSAADFISGYELMSKVYPSLANTANEVNWFKYAYKGKIIFVPNTSITNNNNISISSLYDAGLVFGTDDNGPFQYGPTPKNQRKVIKIKGDDFIVRLPRMNNSPDKTWDGVTLPTSGEWYDLMVRSIDYIPPYQIHDNVFNLMVSNSVPADEITISSYRSPFQEKVNGMNSVAHITGNSADGMTTYVNSVTYGTASHFRPFLEMVSNELFF